MDKVNLFSADFWTGFWESHAEDYLMVISKIVLVVIVYLVVRYYAFKITESLLDSLVEKSSNGMIQARKSRMRALKSAILSAISFVLGFVAILMILQYVGINIVSILTAASVVGLAVGFGSQKLVRDVINGFFILVEDQYGVGDFVSIGAAIGVVEEIGIRTTIIKDTKGRVFIVPNGDVSQVCNYSRAPFALSIDYSVSSNDIDKSIELLNSLGEEIAAQKPKLIKKPFICEGFSSLLPQGASIKYVGIVNPKHQDDIQLEINNRVRQLFIDNQITTI